MGKLMFKLFFGFSSVIWKVILGIVLIAWLGPILLVPVLAVIVLVLLFGGMAFDRWMRKKFGLLDQQMFSPLWTWFSVIELSVFTVFSIITIFGIMPVSILIYDLIIYAILSIVILSRKIKEVSNEYSERISWEELPKKTQKNIRIVRVVAIVSTALVGIGMIAICTESPDITEPLVATIIMAIEAIGCWMASHRMRYSKVKTCEKTKQLPHITPSTAIKDDLIEKKRKMG